MYTIEAKTDDTHPWRTYQRFTDKDSALLALEHLRERHQHHYMRPWLFRLRTPQGLESEGDNMQYEQCKWWCAGFVIGLQYVMPDADDVTLAKMALQAWERIHQSIPEPDYIPAQTDDYYEQRKSDDKRQYEYQEQLAKVQDSLLQKVIASLDHAS